MSEGKTALCYNGKQGSRINKRANNSNQLTRSPQSTGATNLAGQRRFALVDNVLHEVDLGDKEGRGGPCTGRRIRRVGRAPGRLSLPFGRRPLLRRLRSRLLARRMHLPIADQGEEERRSKRLKMKHIKKQEKKPPKHNQNPPPPPPSIQQRSKR